MQRTFGLAAAAMATSNASSKNKYVGALIFLHGLGDTPDGWSELEYTLPEFYSQLSNSNIKYVFPPAPTIPITINGGMRMPGWFDLYDWPIGVGSRDDPKGLQSSVEQMQNEITKLNQQDGIPNSKIVVGGFSQGGAIALLTAYDNNMFSFNEPLAGCVGLSAWLTMPHEFQVSNVAKSTPMFWGHGRFDDKVLFEQQRFGVERLKAQGVIVVDKSYDMGHSSHPEEMKAFADFFHDCIFGSNSNNQSTKEEL